MSKLTRPVLLDLWLQEARQPFEGWDFSYLAGRMIEDKIPWSYEQRAVELMPSAQAAVDMETGGGERLLSLRAYWPPRVVATEGYPPNIKLATERLSPLGVEVVAFEAAEDRPMPFQTGEFDLVLNRHGSFEPGEVARILAEGGTFLTKQVHSLWGWDLMAAFEATTQFPEATPEHYLPRLEAAGLTIVNRADWWGKMRFTDVGAIVYYLLAIPWTVPGFTVETHQDYLFALQDRLEAGQPLEFEIASYMIEARQV